MRKKPPGSEKVVEEPPKSKAGNTAVEQSEPAASRQDEIICEIVARDIERMHRG